MTAVTSTDFSKKLVMTMGTSNIVVWLKLNPAAGDFNVMALEDERPSGRYSVARTMAYVTGANTPGSGTVRLEYVNIGSASSDSTSCVTNGQWSCGYEFHRVFIDEAADVAYLVSNYGLPGANDGSTAAPTSYVQYTAAGKPSELSACSSTGTCTGTLAVSFTADGQSVPGSSSVYPSAGNAYNGCVNVATRALTADATLSCSLTGASILAAGGASAMIELTREVYVNDVVATLLAHTSASTTLAFTGASDIYTAPNTQ
jgi:hypothetical protein